MADRSDEGNSGAIQDSDRTLDYVSDMSLEMAQMCLRVGHEPLGKDLMQVAEKAKTRALEIRARKSRRD